MRFARSGFNGSFPNDPYPEGCEGIAFGKTRAAMMGTNHAQVDRILYPDKGKVTIEKLKYAATPVSRQLRFELAQLHPLSS